MTDPLRDARRALQQLVDAEKLPAGSYTYQLDMKGNAITGARLVERERMKNEIDETIRAQVFAVVDGGALPSEPSDPETP